MGNQETLYPIEFHIAGTPIALGGSSRSKERWKAIVSEVARERVRETDELGFLYRQPFGVTIYYFLETRMQGDVDNIVKPILDVLIRIAYMDDCDVERVLVQKFEPDVPRDFPQLSLQLARALDAPAPVVYVRIDDDLSWRRM